MKDQLTQNNIENKIKQQSCLGSSPPNIDILLPLVQTRSIMAAVKLGIFETIGSGKLSLDQLSTELSLDKDTLERMLYVLVCAGFLTNNNDTYELNTISKRSFLRESPDNLIGFVEYSYVRWHLLDHLEDVLKTGAVFENHECLKTSEDWSSYQKAMFHYSKHIAQQIALLVPVKEHPKKLLDIGGGHGHYGAMICQKHPPMKSTVIDLPQAIESSKQIAIEEGFNDVVDFCPGDALTVEFDNNYDVVFIANLMHYFSPDQNLCLLEKVKKALKNKGTLAILCKGSIQLYKGSMNKGQNLLKANRLLLSRINVGERKYQLNEYKTWLESSGFTNMNVHKIGHGKIVLTAYKQN